MNDGLTTRGGAMRSHHDRRARSTTRGRWARCSSLSARGRAGGGPRRADRDARHRAHSTSPTAGPSRLRLASESAMTAALPYLERLFQWTTRHHFRVPPWGYWCLTVAGLIATLALPLPAALVPLALSAIGVVGLARWRSYRKRPNLLVVPRPATIAPDDHLGTRAQELVVESLSNRLTREELRLVTPIPVQLGPTDVIRAETIRRRLRGLFVLVGRIDQPAAGGWSLFAGLVTAPDKEVTHLDWHTRDRTPARSQWEVRRRPTHPDSRCSRRTGSLTGLGGARGRCAWNRRVRRGGVRGSRPSAEGSACGHRGQRLQ